MDLVARFNRGEPEAFSELFHRHHKGVVRLVARMLGSTVELHDVVQEIFLQIFKSLPQFRGTSRLSTWVYRIGVNVVLMHRRSNRSRPRLVDEEAGPVAADVHLLPDEQVERRRRVAALEHLMEQLSEKKRTVFILHELQGLSPVEISEIVGAPVLTVRTRLFYARRELTDRIAHDARLRLLLPALTEDESHIDRMSSAVSTHGPIQPELSAAPLMTAEYSPTSQTTSPGSRGGKDS
jgi:RNA polymerase sigma-70 factor (ECF subfamily)